jgi:hypothetical protein
MRDQSFVECPRKLLRLLPIILVVATAKGAPFQNMNFESANTNSLMPFPGFGFDYGGPTSDLLPGWQLFLGTQMVTSIGFNLSDDAYGRVGATMVSSEPPYWPPFGAPIEGKYSVAFRVGIVGGGFEQWSIVQQGDVPPDARFLEFRYGELPFAVSVNGVNLSPSFFPIIPRVDVSQFAGQTVELRLTTAPGIFGSGGDHILDAITFVVPEPSVLTLLGVGSCVWVGAVLAKRRRRHRTRSTAGCSSRRAVRAVQDGA